MNDQLLAALRDVNALTPEAFAELGKDLPIEWLDQALSLAPGYAKTRERKLPLDRSLWLLIGMGVFADRSIPAIASHLRLVLPGGKPGVSPSALPQARRRLGTEPLERLLRLTGRHWAVEGAAAHRWRGLSLFAADGSCLNLADTKPNEKEFGRPEGGGCPQARIVALAAVRTHTILAATCGKYTEGEQPLLADLLSTIPANSLTILDRGFVSWRLAHDIRSGGENRHWMIRGKSGLQWREVKRLGPGDALVEIAIHTKARRAHPHLPATLQARVVSYRRKGFRTQRLLTSLMDPEKYPAQEMGALYHERWEIELGYDEIKTHQLEQSFSLRSKSPANVRQEVAAILVAYNLVRQSMSKAAERLRLDPRRISFRNALLSVRNFCITAAMVAPGRLPTMIEGLERDLRLLVLPERRSERRYERTVKKRSSTYKRNKKRGSARKYRLANARSRSGGRSAAI